MHKQKAFHYLERAECFLKLMKLGRNQEIIEDYLGEKMIDYGAGAALLAVHSGISAADAILVHLTGERSTAQDHKMAVEALKKACSKNRFDIKGITHFSWLVSKKDLFAYGDMRVEVSAIQLAHDHAERFLAWLYHTIPGLNAEDRP